jgi:hypothetical protein
MRSTADQTLETATNMKGHILLKAYDGWINPSPNIEIESKYVRETQVLVYSLVFSAYVYTYVALHIHRCLKGEMLMLRL